MHAFTEDMLQHSISGILYPSEKVKILRPALQANGRQVSKDSERFREMAAKALRAARASPDPWRQTCFGVAAFYKRLALDDEILKGERQRSPSRFDTMPS